MTEPNLNHPNEPHVSLMGKSWPIPKLAIRQNRVIVPALMRYFQEVKGVKPKDLTITEANFNDAVNIVHSALNRAHPGLTRTEFEDMPIDTMDMFRALTVIANQTGMMEKVDPELGEASAQPEPLPISTGS